MPALVTSKSLHLLSKLMLLAPVRVYLNPETMEKSYIFHENLYRANLTIVLLIAVGETTSVYWRFQELQRQEQNLSEDELNLNLVHFIPDNIFIFVVFVACATLLSVWSVFQSKPNFPRLQRLHATLREIDRQLEPPPKIGNFKYVATVLVFVYILLRIADCFMYRFTISEWCIFFLNSYSRFVCLTMMIQYEGFVSSIKSRFQSINMELRSELDNYFVQDTRAHRLNCLSRLKMHPARSLSRRRVSELFKLFWLTCRCVKLINESFGTLVFSNIVMSSFFFITTPHFYMINIYTQDVVVSTEHKICALYDCLWLCWSCFQLFFLVLPPAFTSAEGNRTTMIVCEHLHTNTDMYFLNELKTFVFHQKCSPCELVATSILKLKMSLLTTVIGITATYLLISIQIRNAVSKTKSDLSVNG